MPDGSSSYLLSLPVLMMISFAHGPVERRRLARFARRHELAITVGNGPAVIRYLAATRRWRCAGLAAGYLIMALWQIPFGHGFTLYFLAIFAGWFVGAIIAELRLARTPQGEKRVAALHRREPAQYMRRAGWVMLPVATAACVALAVYSGYLALAGHSVHASVAWFWLLSALTVAAGVTVVRRQVLLRPQPVLPADQLDADNAIRARSVHVLTGAGVALVLYCALGQVAAVEAALIETGGLVANAIRLAAFAMFAFIPAIGWAIASERWPISQISVARQSDVAQGAAL